MQYNTLTTGLSCCDVITNLYIYLLFIYLFIQLTIINERPAFIAEHLQKSLWNQLQLTISTTEGLTRRSNMDLYTTGQNISSNFEQRIIHLVYTDIILLSIQLRRRDIIKCSSQIMLNRLKTKLLFLICSSVSQ